MEPVRITALVLLVITIQGTSGTTLVDILEGQIDILPCATPCIIDHPFRVGVYAIRHCMVPITEALEPFNTYPPGRPDSQIYQDFIVNPKHVCNLIDAAAECVMGAVDKFCCTSLKDAFKEVISEPLKTYFDCDFKRDDTMLKCLLNPYWTVNSTLFKSCSEVFDVHISGIVGDVNNITYWYHNLLKDPTKDLCRLEEDLTKCIRTGIKNQIHCSDTTDKDIVRETNAILNLQGCSDPNMDMWPCLANPQMWLSWAECFRPILDKVDINDVNKEPLYDVVRGFDGCMRKSMDETSACRKSGWTLSYYTRFTEPIRDYLYTLGNHKPKSIGQCNSKYEKYPPLYACGGTGTGGAGVIAPTLSTLGLAILLAARTLIDSRV